MEEEESVAAVCLPGDYKGNILFVFENGKVAKVAVAAYDTKTNRRRLTGAYSDKSPLKAVILLTEEDEQIVLYSTEGRALIFSAAQLTTKTTRTSQGVAVMTLKKKYVLDRALCLGQSPIQNPSRYRSRSLPAAGALLREEDTGETQVELEL